MEGALQLTERKCAALESDLATSHTQCSSLESQLTASNEAIEDLHRSRAALEGVGVERLSEITQLTRQLEEERVREGMVRELGEQIDALEEQLSKLQENVSCHQIQHLNIYEKYLVSAEIKFLV